MSKETKKSSATEGKTNFFLLLLGALITVIGAIVMIASLPGRKSLPKSDNEALPDSEGENE